MSAILQSAARDCESFLFLRVYSTTLLRRAHSFCIADHRTIRMENTPLELFVRSVLHTIARTENHCERLAELRTTLFCNTNTTNDPYDPMVSFFMRMLSQGHRLTLMPQHQVFARCFLCWASHIDNALDPLYRLAFNANDLSITPLQHGLAFDDSLTAATTHANSAVLEAVSGVMACMSQSVIVRGNISNNSLRENLLHVHRLLRMRPRNDNTAIAATTIATAAERIPMAVTPVESGKVHSLMVRLLRVDPSTHHALRSITCTMSAEVAIQALVLTLSDPELHGIITSLEQLPETLLDTLLDGNYAQREHVGGFFRNTWLSPQMDPSCKAFIMVEFDKYQGASIDRFLQLLYEAEAEYMLEEGLRKKLTFDHTSMASVRAAAERSDALCLKLLQEEQHRNDLYPVPQCLPTGMPRPPSATTRKFTRLLSRARAYVGQHEALHAQYENQLANAGFDPARPMLGYELAAAPHPQLRVSGSALVVALQFFTRVCITRLRMREEDIAQVFDVLMSLLEDVVVWERDAAAKRGTSVLPPTMNREAEAAAIGISHADSIETHNAGGLLAAAPETAQVVREIFQALVEFLRAKTRAAYHLRTCEDGKTAAATTNNVRFDSFSDCYDKAESVVTQMIRLSALRSVSERATQPAPLQNPTTARVQHGVSIPCEADALLPRLATGEIPSMFFPAKRISVDQLLAQFDAQQQRMQLLAVGIRLFQRVHQNCCVVYGLEQHIRAPDITETLSNLNRMHPSFRMGCVELQTAFRAAYDGAFACATTSLPGDDAFLYSLVLVNGHDLQLHHRIYCDRRSAFPEDLIMIADGVDTRYLVFSSPRAHRRWLQYSVLQSDTTSNVRQRTFLRTPLMLRDYATVYGPSRPRCVGGANNLRYDDCDTEHPRNAEARAIMEGTDVEGLHIFVQSLQHELINAANVKLERWYHAQLLASFLEPIEAEFQCYWWLHVLLHRMILCLPQQHQSLDCSQGPDTVNVMQNLCDALLCFFAMRSRHTLPTWLLRQLDEYLATHVEHREEHASLCYYVRFITKHVPATVYEVELDYYNIPEHEPYLAATDHVFESMAPKSEELRLMKINLLFYRFCRDPRVDPLLAARLCWYRRSTLQHSRVIPADITGDGGDASGEEQHDDEMMMMKEVVSSSEDEEEFYNDMEEGEEDPSFAAADLSPSGSITALTESPARIADLATGSMPSSPPRPPPAAVTLTTTPAHPPGRGKLRAKMRLPPRQIFPSPLPPTSLQQKNSFRFDRQKLSKLPNSGWERFGQVEWQHHCIFGRDESFQPLANFLLALEWILCRHGKIIKSSDGTRERVYPVCPWSFDADAYLHDYPNAGMPFQMYVTPSTRDYGSLSYQTVEDCLWINTFRAILKSELVQQHAKTEANRNRLGPLPWRSPTLEDMTYWCDKYQTVARLTIDAVIEAERGAATALANLDGDGDSGRAESIFARTWLYGYIHSKYYQQRKSKLLNLSRLVHERKIPTRYAIELPPPTPKRPADETDEERVRKAIRYSMPLPGELAKHERRRREQAHMQRLSDPNNICQYGSYY